MPQQYPERTVESPQLPGQPNFGPSKLKLLRRQQLVDLAKAFDLEIDRDGTKEQILPVILVAESRGVFRQLPKRPFYLARAQRNADDPKLQVTPLEVAGVDDPDEIISPASRQETNTVHNMLQKECKALGISSFGKSIAWMLAAITEKHKEMRGEKPAQEEPSLVDSAFMRGSPGPGKAA